MHVPDGFLDAPTSVATGVVAAGTVAVALRKARDELDERTAPMAGLVAAFIFATQMLNFPVGAGTSGHLLGGALAAVLVGPWTAILCMSAVLLVQALLFADGGLTRPGHQHHPDGRRHGRGRLGRVQGSSPRLPPRRSARRRRRVPRRADLGADAALPSSRCSRSAAPPTSRCPP